MQISASRLAEYTAALNAQQQAAFNFMQTALRSFYQLNGGMIDAETMREFAMQTLTTCVQTFGDRAATIACSAYDVTMEEFIGYLSELEVAKCIRLYTVGDGVFIDIPNFGTYQTISHPSKTNIPEPSSSTPVVLHECSMSSPPNELINELMNQRARGGDADAPPAPDDWMAASPMYSKGGAA